MLFQKVCWKYLDYKILGHNFVESSRAGCLVLCAGDFWKSLGMPTPQPSWSTCGSAWSPLQWKSVSLCSDGTSCVSFCAHCFLSCQTIKDRMTVLSCLWMIFGSAACAFVTDGVLDFHPGTNFSFSFLQKWDTQRLFLPWYTRIEWALIHCKFKLISLSVPYKIDCPIWVEFSKPESIFYWLRNQRWVTLQTHGKAGNMHVIL